jgi:hypothetical protein
VFLAYVVNVPLKAGTKRRRISDVGSFPVCSPQHVVSCTGFPPRIHRLLRWFSTACVVAVNLCVPDWGRCHPPMPCGNQRQIEERPVCGLSVRVSRPSPERQAIYWPPLADMVEPVMKPASSEARKTTQRAISSGSPRRPTGICGMMRSLSTFSSMALTISVAM